MAAQVALLSLSREELDAFIDTIPLTNGFAEFVAWCRKAALPLTIVSDGLDYVIHRVLARHGIAPVPIIANALRQAGEREYELSFPHGAPGCPSGVCKCTVKDRLTGTKTRTLLIGDGL